MNNQTPFERQYLQQRDRDLVSTNRQVQEMRKAVAEYEREYSDCPEELPGGYFRALQSLQEWEGEFNRLLSISA
jgi:hypothetical protein